MNGLVLPTGPNAPIKRDTQRNPPSPSSPDIPRVKSEVYDGLLLLPSARETVRGNRVKSEPTQSVAATESATVAYLEPSNGASIPSPTSKAATSAVFIPRTSQTSVFVRKPLSRCSQFELQQMLDRNQRILATLGHACDGEIQPHFLSSADQLQLQSQFQTRKRIQNETEEIRKQIQLKQAIREVDDGLERCKLDSALESDATDYVKLQEAMSRLDVNKAYNNGFSIETDTQNQSSAWTRDTLSVKKKLAQQRPSYKPGCKAQQLSFEQSLSLQSAALMAEMERDHKAKELRFSMLNKASPSGTAHRLGRKSISSSGNSTRKMLSSSPKSFGACPGFGLPRKHSSSQSPTLAHTNLEQHGDVSDLDLPQLDAEDHSDPCYSEDDIETRVRPREDEDYSFDF